MKPIIDHIQITVQDLDRAEKFYDKLLPILGFDLNKKLRGRVDANDFDVIEYAHEILIIGFNSPRPEVKDDPPHRRRPGALHHLAFRAESEEEVDRVYDEIKSLKFEFLEPPRLYPQHGDHYYALFFKDTEGIKWEVMMERK